MTLSNGSSPAGGGFARRHAGRASALVNLLLDMVTITLRCDQIRGEERLQRFVAEGRPVILVSWHNRLMGLAWLITRRLVPGGHRMAVLVSLSQDGEILAGVSRRQRVQVIRGSASRGGVAAMRAIRSVLAESRRSLTTVADGPRGPLYVCKPGAVVMAQLSGAPILPVGFAAQRSWRLRSWDRFIVPRPFTRIAVTIGEPVEVPRRLTRDQVESRTRELERALLSEGERAARALLG